MLRVSFFFSACLHLVLLGVASAFVSQWVTPELPKEQRFRVELRENVAATAGVSATGTSAGRAGGESRINAAERLLPPTFGRSPEVAKSGTVAPERFRPASQEWPLPQTPFQKTQRVPPEPLQPLAPPPPQLQKPAPNVRTTQPLTPTLPEIVAQARDFPTPMPKKATSIPPNAKAVARKATPFPPKSTPIPGKPTPFPANAAPDLSASAQVSTGISETSQQPPPVTTPDRVAAAAQTPPDATSLAADVRPASTPQADAVPTSRLGPPGTTPGISSTSPGTGNDSGNEGEPQGQARPTTSREKTLLNQYLQDVAAKIKAVQQYPKNARAEGWEGTVVIKLRILPSGKVETVALAAKSNYESLNEAALQAIRKAQPFPEFSRGLDLPAITVNIPIQFTLN